MFVDNGYEATDLGQCPHLPGTDAWKRWQHEFMGAQSSDPARLGDAHAVARARLGVLRERVVASRTPAQQWHDDIMAEVVEPKPWTPRDLPGFGLWFDAATGVNFAAVTGTSIAASTDLLLGVPLEVVVYSRALTPLEERSVWAYLTAKWESKL